MRKIIGVIGGRRATKSLLANAEKVGRLIAEDGLILLCGGLGGVMEAAAKGAKEAGGLTVGILPHDTKEHANPLLMFLSQQGSVSAETSS